MTRTLPFPIILLVLATCVLGCGPRNATTEVRSNPTTERICTITAELMGVDRSRIHAETSLGDLKADELDFVELVMEMEEYFDISIPDERVESMMATGTWPQGIKGITMGKLGALVDELRREGGRDEGRP